MSDKNSFNPPTIIPFVSAQKYENSPNNNMFNMQLMTSNISNRALR